MPSEPSTASDMLLYLLGFFLPPLAVFFKRGCAADFWINIGLSILGWLPGVVHAWWIIGKFPGHHHTHTTTPVTTGGTYGATTA